MTEGLKCWKKVKSRGNLWENDSKSQKAQRHIIEKVGVSPILLNKFVVFKDKEDEKYLTSTISSIKVFDNKSKAISFAKSYMKEHDKC